MTLPVEHEVRYRQAFDRWFMSNGLAVQACIDLMTVVHLWDDLYDKDKDVQPEAADVAMRKAMIDMPSNPFWRENILYFLPVMQSVYLQWSAANVMERDRLPNDREKAYMLRASVYQMFCSVAVVCGGIDWAKEIAPEIFRFYDETVEQAVPQGGKHA